MQWHKFTALHTVHRIMWIIHQCISETKSPMRPQYWKRSDMSMGLLLSISFVLIIHLRKHISTYRPILFCDIQQSWPWEIVVEVVLKHVVLRETPEVAVLDLVEVFKSGSSEGWHLWYLYNTKVIEIMLREYLIGHIRLGYLLIFSFVSEHLLVIGLQIYVHLILISIPPYYYLLHLFNFGWFINIDSHNLSSIVFFVRLFWYYLPHTFNIHLWCFWVMVHCMILNFLWISPRVLKSLLILRSNYLDVVSRLKELLELLLWGLSMHFICLESDGRWWYYELSYCNLQWQMHLPRDLGIFLIGFSCSPFKFNNYCRCWEIVIKERTFRN
jgi:hypothetical protein